MQPENCDLSLDIFSPGQDKDRQVIEARRMLTEELPHDNYQVIKFIMDLLVEVSHRNW